MPDGELAIVLHTHMPYVEGFGTWPFGEEWLWEAAATSYVPLLEVLERRGAGYTREHLSLSLTPVLCDQLEAPGALERCVRFLREVRPETHRLDGEEFRQAGDTVAMAELERSAAAYAHAADALEPLARDAGRDRVPAERPAQPAQPTTRMAQPAAHAGAGAAGGLAAALGAHATWTSAATHAILPLLATADGLDAQVRVGIESHRERFGEWDGGFWLPECGHEPWLNAILADMGVRCMCVELTRQLGRGDARNLVPYQPDEGPLLIPIDRATIDLVWGAGGYPSRPAYRDTHRRTRHDHHVWANDGSFYDHDRATAQARQDAREFVAAVKDRVAGGGLCVCALDTELLGHWWHEGPEWLAAVIEEAERQRLTLTALNGEAAARHPAAAIDIRETQPATSWGLGNDLRTWSAPPVADLAWQARTAELRTFERDTAPSPRALRELLALQSSDWAFVAYNGWAGDYPRQRASGHAAQLARALGGELEEPHVRNLAPFLAG